MVRVRHRGLQPTNANEAIARGYAFRVIRRPAACRICQLPSPAERQSLPVEYGQGSKENSFSLATRNFLSREQLTGPFDRIATEPSSPNRIKSKLISP